MAQKIFTVDVDDANELAGILCGITDDDDAERIEAALYEKYEISFDKFHELLTAMFEKLSLGISPLTDTAFIGFSLQEGNAGRWIIKKEANAEFISGVLQWLGADEITEETKGMQREITSGDIVEFVITIKKP